MLKSPRRLAAAMTLLGSAIAYPADSYAFDLTGAWTTESDLCDRVFAKKDGKVVFAEFSDMYGSGFVVDGNRIKGKAAQCTIVSRKEEGSDVALSAACATAIMRQDVKFDLKIVDDDTITRLLPEVPGMTLKYTRCKL